MEFLVSLIWYGIQRNVSATELSNDWSECYRDTYAVDLNSNILASIFQACNKGHLLLACRPINTTIFTVAAMGSRADVLYNCNSSVTCTNVGNGVGWYFSNNLSWGFVDYNDTVLLSPCDVLQTNPSYELCWYTGQGIGGGQCGAINASNYTILERVIYHA